MKTYVLFLAILCGTRTQAQSNQSWNGKKCAVVLTYDDGLNVHLTNAIPVLDSMGLKGTFYISDYFDGLKDQIRKWRKAAAHGHELANHSIWHPCEGGRPGREFVKPDYDLNNYSVKRMVNEVKEMSNILEAIDGKRKRTFAYPCGDTEIHDTAYIDPLRNDFVAARGVRPQMLTADQIDLYDVPCYTVNGQSGKELIALVKQALEKNALLVFLFHGVGGEHNLNVSLEAHSALLHFLKQNQKQIWVATMIDVAEHIKKYQSQKK
ncbi:MAG: polysaccharide deacetylase [Bacteroidetes bacterium]|nr:MAG: polysaccharide deacetylase [Bacteroidota bacterium]